MNKVKIVKAAYQLPNQEYLDLLQELIDIVFPKFCYSVTLNRRDAEIANKVDDINSMIDELRELVYGE